MGNQFEVAVVHPLVLLSVVDHFHRVAKGTTKRVLGVLLGEVSKGRIDITNSFAVPFEEDERDTKIWFLDHSYLENMYAMFKKVNAREKIVGWYHTGPRLRESDLDIQELMSNYCPNPILVVCEVEPKDLGLPTTAYYSKDHIREDGTQKSQKIFVNIPTEVGATEAEEIGVEHLLRDVKDATVSTLATDVGRMVTGLRGLKSRIEEIMAYMKLVCQGAIPVNHDILYQLQDVTTLLPNLSLTSLEELHHAFAVKSNDMMLVIYLASVIRAILALHNLIENKEHRVWKETAALPEKSVKNGKAEGPKNGLTTNGEEKGSGKPQQDKNGGSN